MIYAIYRPVKSLRRRSHNISGEILKWLLSFPSYVFFWTLEVAVRVIPGGEYFSCNEFRFGYRHEVTRPHENNPCSGFRGIGILSDSSLNVGPGTIRPDMNSIRMFDGGGSREGKPWPSKGAPRLAGTRRRAEERLRSDLQSGPRPLPLLPSEAPIPCSWQCKREIRPSWIGC